MGLFRRLFSRTLRRARRVEGEGDLRGAAALYAEAGSFEEASAALERLARQAADLDESLRLYDEAARWLPEEHADRARLEVKAARLTLEEARIGGVLTSTERIRLRDAARLLEERAEHVDAADAFELLGMSDDTARCLQSAGSVERLEALLGASAESEGRERVLRSQLDMYQMAMRVGARREALGALRLARDAEGETGEAAILERSLEDRRPLNARVELSVEGRRWLLVGRSTILLGREGDWSLRGASVSRRHVELERDDAGVLVRDLGSRNGTLIGGVAAAAEVRVEGSTELGLGDDLQLALRPAAGHVELAVVRGMGRDERCRFGGNSLRLEGLAGEFRFEAGWVVFSPDAGAGLRLDLQRCAAPVELLSGDILEVEGRRVEVLG